MNQETRPEVVICLGSSCFSRGNKQTVRILDDLLKVNNLKEKVFFHGGHCFGRCVDGPIIKIGETVIEHFDPDLNTEILDFHFKKLKV
jgi:NADH:ubiquinone oxidoreductase subunit E